MDLGTAHPWMRGNGLLQTGAIDSKNVFTDREAGELEKLRLGHLAQAAEGDGGERKLRRPECPPVGENASRNGPRPQRDQQYTLRRQPRQSSARKLQLCPTLLRVRSAAVVAASPILFPSPTQGSSRRFVPLRPLCPPLTLSPARRSRARPRARA